MIKIFNFIIIYCLLSHSLSQINQEVLSQTENVIDKIKIDAEKGDPISQYKLYQLYYYGTGVSKDIDSAYYWAQQSSNQNYPPAISALGWFFFTGEKVKKDQSKAFELFLKASQLHDKFGSIRAAYCYSSGQGVDRNEKEAIKLYEAAGVQGDPSSLVYAGDAYNEGTFVKKDEDKALIYFLRAAYLQDAFGQSRLAYYFWNKHDTVQACKWISLSHGNNPADSDIKKMYDFYMASLSESERLQVNQLIKNWPREEKGDFQDQELICTFVNKSNSQTKLEYLQGLIVVHAQVEAHPARLLIDTGSSTSILTDKFCNLWKIRGDSICSVIGGQNNCALVKYKKNLSLKIDNLSITNATFGLVDLDRVIPDLDGTIDGIIGTDILKNYIIFLDIENQIIKFDDPVHFNREAKLNPLGLDLINNELVKLVIKNNNASAELPFLIDTGNDGSFIATAKVEQLKPELKFSQLSTCFREQGSEGAANTKVSRISEIRLGDYVFTNALIYTFTNSNFWQKNFGMIGNEVLRRFKITIDYPDKKIYFESNKSINDKFTFLEPLGFSTRPDPEKHSFLIVDTISPDSVAEKAGLKSGDTIVKVNDVDVATKSLEEIIKMKLFGSEGIYKVEVDRAGKNLIITMERRFL